MSWLDDLHKVVLDNQQGFGAAAGALSAGRGIGGAGAAFAQGRGLDLQRAQKTKQQEMQESLLARQKEMRESMTGANAPQWMQNLDEATRGYVGSNPQLFDNVMRDQVMRSMNPSEPAKRQTMKDASGRQRYVDDQSFVFDDMDGYSNASDRQTMKGADGYQYYTDDQSRVLPDVQMTPKTTNRKSIKAADGYSYYTDDGSRVLPNIEKPVKFTDTQSKAGLFANRASKAETAMERIVSSGYEPVQKDLFGVLHYGRELKPQVAQSEEQKIFNAAKSDWISAVLRLESGAAIADSEFDRFDVQYFPQAGDTPNVLQSKKRARENAIAGLITMSGGAYEAIGGQSSGGASGGWNVVGDDEIRVLP